MENRRARRRSGRWVIASMRYLPAIGLLLSGMTGGAIGLGTAVTPTYPRHPVAIAQQALTTAAASGPSWTAGQNSPSDAPRPRTSTFRYA